MRMTNNEREPQQQTHMLALFPHTHTHTHACTRNTHMVLIMQRTAAGVWKSWENGSWNRANQLPPEPAPVCLYLPLTASQWEVIMENIYISYYVQVSKRNRRRARRKSRSLYFLPVKSRGKVNMDDFFFLSLSLDRSHVCRRGLFNRDYANLSLLHVLL